MELINEIKHEKRYIVAILDLLGASDWIEHGDSEGLLNVIIYTFEHTKKYWTQVGHGYIFIGVADKDDDVKRIVELDNIQPIKITSHSVVGIDREAYILGISLENYCRKIIGFIKESRLSETLISSVLSNMV